MTGSTRMGDLFAGPAASTWEDLGCYTGLAGAERIVGGKRRAAYIANYNQLDVKYRGGVEFQLRRNMVLLCPQTAQFLYQSFTPERMSYSGGPRRYLEDTVHRVVAPEGDASEKVLALMRFCRDLYKPTKRFPSHRDYVYGGTEEELIKKGEWTCECLARLFVALCELVGISGRVLYHAIGGHVTTEVDLDLVGDQRHEGVHTELAALDLGFGREAAGVFLLVHRIGLADDVIDIERNRLGRTMHGQIAFYRGFIVAIERHARRLETHLRIFVDFEKAFRVTQVFVALVVTGIYRSRIERHVHAAGIALAIHHDFAAGYVDTAVHGG